MSAPANVRERSRVATTSWRVTAQGHKTTTAGPAAAGARQALQRALWGGEALDAGWAHSRAPRPTATSPAASGSASAAGSRLEQTERRHPAERPGGRERDTRGTGQTDTRADKLGEIRTSARQQGREQTCPLYSRVDFYDVSLEHKLTSSLHPVLLIIIIEVLDRYTGSVTS